MALVMRMRMFRMTMMKATVPQTQFTAACRYAKGPYEYGYCDDSDGEYNDEDDDRAL